MARTLGPYKIHSELGRGAMAVVWRAHDSVLERDVAIKEPLLPQGLDALAQTEFGARFVREAKAAARLNHPNIVTIHAADIYDGHPAIVMELIEGQTLGQMLERGPLDKALAIHVLEQLLSAVGYAHERGIVHRDIKPDNIFVTPDGRVKLADFGIASLASDSTLTQAGTIMGTPGYMAPEQITGAPVDGRADLFSCGVLAYEMLTGQNPFGATEGLPTTTVMYRIVHQAPPELPAEALAELPANLSSVLGAALAKDPADRFSDAASFLAALGGQGSLPVPGLGTAVGAAQGMGTMMARLSRVKSATMISRGPGKPQEASWTKSWLPYAAVVGIGLIIMIALLASAGGGGGGAVTASTQSVDLSLEAAVSASSFLSPSATSTYYPANLVDDNPATCWGADWEGSGVWVQFDFSTAVTVSRLRIIAGYQKSGSGGDSWSRNDRLRAFTVQFSDGTEVTKQVLDERGYQDVDLPPTETTYVRIVVLAVYPYQPDWEGQGWDDISVSEIHPWGYAAPVSGVDGE